MVSKQRTGVLLPHPAGIEADQVEPGSQFGGVELPRSPWQGREPGIAGAAEVGEHAADALLRVAGGQPDQRQVDTGPAGSS